MNNKFITFEGVEGSGKTTQSRKLYDYLLAKNLPAILTREIGGTKEAEKIRQIIVHDDISPITELMLIIAARYEHANKIIIPALKKDKWVICDRYIDSTFAYQGSNIKDGFNIIYDLHQKLIQPDFAEINRSFMPDLTFFIDLPPNISLSRTKNRNDNNKFEEKDVDFHKQIYDQFQYIARQFENRITTINALDLTEEEIFHKIIKRAV